VFKRPGQTEKEYAAELSASLRSLESLHEQMMAVAVASNTKKAIKIAVCEDALREVKLYLVTSGCFDSRKRELVDNIDKALQA
jgi:hypothetical protein